MSGCMTCARIAELADEAALDCERDVEAMEGKPFDGRTVAEGFGNTLALVKFLADAVKHIASHAQGES